MDILYKYSEEMETHYIRLYGWKDSGESFHKLYHILPVELGSG